MVKLLYNPDTQQLQVSDKEMPGYRVLMQPFDIDSKNRFKKQESDIIIPNSLFSFKIITSYKKSSSILCMRHNGKELYKFTEVLHYNTSRKFNSIDDLSKIRVSLTSNNDEEWTRVFEIIKDTYDNLATWQANEILKMVAELKTLISEAECYDLMWDGYNNRSTAYTGLQLNMLKVQKLMEAISMLQITGMHEIHGAKEDITRMCIDLLPLMKECYLSELCNNEQLLAELEDAQKQCDLANKACKRKEEYVAHMLKDNYSKPLLEKAEARFALKYPKEVALIDSQIDIENYYSQKSAQWKKTLEYRLLVENAISVILEFMKNTGCFNHFLRVI